MEAPTLETFQRITFTGGASTNGLTAEFIPALGLTIKCTAMGFSLGRMGEGMKGNTLTIKSRAEACSSGQIVVSTSEAGIMGNSTAKGPM